MSYSIVTYSIMRYSTVTYSIMRYSTVTDSIMRYSIVTYSIVTYITVKYSTVRSKNSRMSRELRLKKNNKPNFNGNGMFFFIRSAPRHYLHVSSTEPAFAYENFE